MARSWRQQLQAGRRLAIVGAGFACFRDLDPAVHAGLAFLHDREIDRLTGLEIAGEIALEDELVIPGIGQLAALPGYLDDALGELPVKQLVGFWIFAGH